MTKCYFEIGITKQYCDDQVKGCVRKARPQGINPDPTDLHVYAKSAP